MIMENLNQKDQTIIEVFNIYYRQMPSKTQYKMTTITLRQNVDIRYDSDLLDNLRLNPDEDKAVNMLYGLSEDIYQWERPTLVGLTKNYKTLNKKSYCSTI